MNGKANEEIVKEREELTEFAKAKLGSDVEIIDSYFKDAPHDAKPLWFLGKLKGIKELDDGSIQIMFIAEDGAEMSQIIPVTGFLYPIAKLLFEKNGIWRVKR